MVDLINFENYLKLKVASKSVKTYLERIRLYFKTYEDFNQDNINSFFVGLMDKKLSSSTFNLSIIALKYYSQFLKVNIEFPKTRKTSKINRVTLKKDEIEKDIFPYFGMMFKDYNKMKFIVRFMMLTCMRISEVENLKKDDVDIKTKIIYINKGKGQKDRKVFIHDSIIDELQYYMSKSKTDSALDITKGTIRYLINQINKQLNYKKHITPHTLRRAGALYIFQQTKNDLKFVKNFLGHESIETTDKYLNYDIEEMEHVWKQVKYKKG